MRTLAPFVEAMPHGSGTISTATLTIYAKALAPLSVAEVEAAMLKLMRTSKFFPSVAEIFEQAENMRQHATGGTIPTPDEAWHEAMELVRTCHVYKPWAFSCPAMEQAVKNFGKMELCTLEAKEVSVARAQFMRIYASCASRQREKRHNDAVLAAMPKTQREALAKVGEVIAGVLGNQK